MVDGIGRSGSSDGLRPVSEGLVGVVRPDVLVRTAELTVSPVVEIVGWCSGRVSVEERIGG